MAGKVSTGLRKQLYGGGRGAVSSLRAIKGGPAYGYTGPQPTNADAAVQGTKVAEITADGGDFTYGSYATSDADGVCTSQTPSSPGTLTINGAAASAGVATLGLGAYVTFTSTGDCSSVLFEVTGLDDDGNSQVEYLYGPNNTTVATKNTWTSITQIKNFLALPAAITVGWGITNGLLFAIDSSGNLIKHPDQDWKLRGIAAGTLGWIRIMGSQLDDLGASLILPRLDGNCSTTGGVFQFNSLSVSGVGYTDALTSFTFNWNSAHT